MTEGGGGRVREGRNNRLLGVWGVPSFSSTLCQCSAFARKEVLKQTMRCKAIRMFIILT